MSIEYGIPAKRTACLLDTFSCIFQGVIPYGAQMLLAISVSAEHGVNLSAFEIMQYLFYPYLLLISSLVAICLTKYSKKK
jgi:Na+/H+ antiporter NhaC